MERSHPRGYSPRINATESSNDSFRCKMRCVEMPGHGKSRQVSMWQMYIFSPLQVFFDARTSTILLKNVA